MQTIDIKDLVFAYTQLRCIVDKTEREKEMLAVLEPHLYDILTSLRTNPSPQYRLLMDAIRAFTSGDVDGCKAIMDKLTSTQAAS